MDFTNLKNFMDDMARERTPGNAVEVYLDGKSVFRYASGYADIETKTSMTGEEMFYIYSCTKIATATAGMQLLERGKILLNEPLYEYIPEFKDMCVKTPEGNLVKAENPITIGDLFKMTAGFDYNLKSPGIQKAREITNGKMDTVDVVKCLASEPLSFQPGTNWQYSLCHDVLAAVISVVSGKKFRDYVRENLFEPLGMTESVYHNTPETIKRMASQYCFVSYEDKVQDAVEAQKNGSAKDGFLQNAGKGNGFILGEEYDSGGAGIITTVPDYMKLIAALANRGMGLTGERILSGYAVDLMRTDHLTPEQKKGYNWRSCAGCGYGLGVRTHTTPAQSGIISNLGEFGWGGAAGSSVIVDPTIRLGVFYVQHTLNPREHYYQPRLRNVVYSCL